MRQRKRRKESCDKDAAMRKIDLIRWKRQVEKLRLEDGIQGKLQKYEPVGGGSTVLPLFMTDTDELKDVSTAS